MASKKPLKQKFTYQRDNENTEPEERVEKDPVVAQGTSSSHARNFTGEKKVFTDLFKLTVAKVIKYMGWEKEGEEHPDTHPDKFSTWEHTHPFRTYDKKGQKIYTCTPIGGHFHVIEWEQGTNKDETPKIKSVSGPMVMARKKIKGRLVMVPTPANEFDDHTHDVEYIRSGELVFSTANVEAAKVMAFEASKTAPLAGVVDGGARQ